ncbi:MAG: hypothetical protein JSR21_00915 [Proteobacteria bacterium]|nr:hypothetical protein [Pseudomonadota bacterium]
MSVWTPFTDPAIARRWFSASGTQAFLLVGTLVLLPVIPMYAAWSSWVFRGKVRDGSGYR